MMKKVLFLCLIMAGALSVVFAAPAMYSVDYKLLIALHPKMANYDMVIERHLRSDVNFADMNQLNALNMRIASLSIAAYQKTEKLLRDKDRVELELARLDNRMTGKIADFDHEKMQFQGENTRKSQLLKISQLKAQLSEIDNQTVKIWDEVMNPLYLSRAQSKQVVESVLSEIDLMLEGMSRQMGGALIIDSDFQAIQFAPERITAAPVVGADPLSIRLYQSLLNSDLVGNVPDVYKNDPELARYASAMRKDIEDSFDKNMAKQISKSPLLGKTAGIQGRLVLAGAQGFDLTRQAVENMFKKHGIRADIASRILALIK